MAQLKSLLPFAAAALAGAALAAAAPISAIPLRQLDESALPVEAIKGKVALFVNVASRCGYTKQYKGLEALYQSHKAAGFTIVGVPCNQFGEQEPGSAAEIKTFCSTTYGVTFPLLSKQEVNGAGRSPLYTALISSPVGGGGDLGWNFEKFLVGRDGAVKGRYKSSVTPEDPKLAADIARELAAAP